MQALLAFAYINKFSTFCCVMLYFFLLLSLLSHVTYNADNSKCGLQTFVCPHTIIHSRRHVSNIILICFVHSSSLIYCCCCCCWKWRLRFIFNENELMIELTFKLKDRNFYFLVEKFKWKAFPFVYLLMMLILLLILPLFLTLHGHVSWKQRIQTFTCLHFVKPRISLILK